MTIDQIMAPSINEVNEFLNNMKFFIESGQHADWTAFNQAKKSFLEAFKTIQNSPEKQVCWKNFTEIADTARAIRKIQEEEGEFAAEMIAKALDALEAEIENPKIESIQNPLFSKVASFKMVKQELSYSLAQLRFFMTLADQIQSLRYELAKTGMRLSIKGRLFDRLSTLGDKVFPFKKQISVKMTELFHLGLNAFQKEVDKAEDGLEIIYQVRIIQSFLKELNLKKSQYDQVKQILDPIWKKASLMKEKKDVLVREQAIKMEALKKSFDDSFAQMKALVLEGNDGEAMKIYDSISLKLKDRQIQKNEFRVLKHELETIASPIFDRIKEQQEAKKQESLQKASLLDGKKQELLKVIQEATTLEEKKSALNLAISLNLNSSELYRYKYIYFAEALGRLVSPDDLEDLYFEVKKLQEALRSQLATSGLDFTQNMNLQEIHDDVKQLVTDIVKKLD